MGREDISQDDLIEAGKLSGLDEFISKIPGGYDLQLCKIKVMDFWRTKTSNSFNKSFST